MGEAIDVALRIVQVALATLFGASSAGGYLAWRAKRKANAAAVAQDTATAQSEHQRDLLKELRLISDYADRLRHQVRSLGGDPIDWPDTLRHIT